MSEQIDELARAVAALVAAGSPVEDARPALAARDTLVRALKSLTAAILHAGPVSGADLRPEHVASDPAHVLHAVLQGMPPSLADPPAPTELVASASAPWRDVVRAALALDLCFERVEQLEPVQAWAVLRDTGEITAAVPFIDTDLAAQLPDHMTDERITLGHPTVHAMIRVASSELRLQTREVPDVPDALRPSTSRTVVLVRSPEEVPTGMIQLQKMIRDAGGSLAAVDMRTAIRLLLTGTSMAQKLSLDLSLCTATSALRQALIEPLATLTPRRGSIAAQCTELYRQLPHAVHDELSSKTWCHDAAAVIKATGDAARCASHSGRMMTRPDDQIRGRATRLMWLPTRPDRSHPVVSALDVAHDAMMCPDGRSLTTFNSDPAGVDREVQTSIDAANRAVTNLRDILEWRDETPSPGPSRTDHPAIRRTTG